MYYSQRLKIAAPSVRAIEIVFEKIDIHRICRPSVLAPKLVAGEFHGIEMFRHIPLSRCQRLVVAMGAMIDFDDADLALSEGRKPGMPDRVDVLCPDTVAQLELGRSIERPIMRSAIIEYGAELFGIVAGIGWFR